MKLWVKAILFYAFGHKRMEMPGYMAQLQLLHRYWNSNASLLIKLMMCFDTDHFTGRAFTTTLYGKAGSMKKQKIEEPTKFKLYKGGHNKEGMQQRSTKEAEIDAARKNDIDALCSPDLLRDRIKAIEKHYMALKSNLLNYITGLL